MTLSTYKQSQGFFIADLITIAGLALFAKMPPARCYMIWACQGWTRFCRGERRFQFWREVAIEQFGALFAVSGSFITAY